MTEVLRLYIIRAEIFYIALKSLNNPEDYVFISVYLNSLNIIT